MLVHGYQIIGTDTQVWNAWDEGAQLIGTHSSLTSFDGLDGWYGRVGTRMLPKEVDAIPVGQARFDAVHDWHEGQYQEAYQAILDEAPWLSDFIWRVGAGEIVTRVER